MKKEIGGYLELDRYTLPMLHEQALGLSCGRACLEYLILQKKIEKLAMPRFICDTVRQVCFDHSVALREYDIGPDFLPVHLVPRENEWIYIVNYYGQLRQEQLSSFAAAFPRMILDNAQAYFAPPLPGIDTLYTCRKFFGVADGGFLYTDAPYLELERDESWSRMCFVLGRFERSAQEFFPQASENNDIFASLPLRRMSRLTENLLHGIDYAAVEKIRTENFLRLHNALRGINMLDVHPVIGAFAYPLMVKNASELRKQLISRQIYVPTLWPNVLREADIDSTEYALAGSILPLPCDQRYGAEEMDEIIKFFV